MVGQDAHLTVGSRGDDHVRVLFEDDAFRGHQFQA
jgi:hypothetical protein